MSLKALVYAYFIGGITFIPFLAAFIIFYAIYTSVPVNSSNPQHVIERNRDESFIPDNANCEGSHALPHRPSSPDSQEVDDAPKQRKSWLRVRRTFEESTLDGSYVTLMKSFLDARSKDPKRSRPKDMWYSILKGKVLYLYEDEAMTECEAAIELGGHDVSIYPESLQDGELFAKRNAICLNPKVSSHFTGLPSVTKDMRLGPMSDEKAQSQQSLVEREREAVKEQALDVSTPWFIFVRSNIEMEDWYLALLHASDHPANKPTLDPLQSIFDPYDMARLVETLDEQPDVIPMRWLNALLGRVFFSYYRTHVLEEYIISRLMKKLSKVKRPTFLSDVVVTEVSVGNTPPVFSKPMLKELTKEGDASMEVHLNFKGEIRITVQAVATINLGARFKSYSVKLVLAVVLRQLEGNLLVRVKRPPSNRIWYAFTQPPRMVLDVEPVVSDRQITWNMVLSSIESRLREIILESVVMPNMDDVAFFQSTDYIHRGGIWPDAVRREKQTTPHSGLTRPAPTLDVGDPSRVVSLPQETTTDNIVTQPVKPPLERAHSTGDLQREELLSNGDAAALQATTTVIPDSPLISSTVKRRSWFSSVLGEGSGSDSDEIPDNVSRGRTNGNDSINTPSSRSASSHSDLPDHPDDKHLTSRRPPPPLPPRVSTGKDVSEGSSTPPKPLQFPRTNTATSNSPPTSFFSTLKARAGDKQALSNSAKEAMKKWSANWNAMRRDTTDDAPDAGVHDRNASDANSQNQRAGYVNVRKKADERQRTVSVNEVGGPQLFDTNVNERTISYTPRESRRGSRSASISGSLVASSSPHTESPVPASSDAREGFTSTEVHISPDDPLREVEMNLPTSVPIYTQPSQARTMTIPGIHASHRGEVMSMGYVAASPAPAPESKPKTPAIQSVYRLWKNPASPSEQIQEQELEPSARTKESESPPGPSKPLPRMVPPPLPPRSVSTTVIRPIETLQSNSALSDVSASAALKSIAAHDESRRVSIEKVDVPPNEDVLPSPS